MKKFVFSLMMFGFLFLGISNENVVAQSSKDNTTLYHFRISTNSSPDYILPDFWIKMTWIPAQGSTGYSKSVSFTNRPVNYNYFDIEMPKVDFGTMHVSTNLFDVLPFPPASMSLPFPFTPNGVTHRNLGIGFTISTISLD